MDDEIIALTDQIEALKRRLSEARRRRPPEPVADYTLQESRGGPVRLSDLFGNRNDLLVVHNMGRGCVYCTLWADGFNGLLDHLQDRTAFVVATPDDPATQQQFAASRNWRFRMVSTAGSQFSEDMGFEVDGAPMPGVSAFQRTADGAILRTGFDSFGPDDDYSPPWRLFDLLASGRGEWEPRYRYGSD
jgi:predicted dithiol-disulfide oxidoreductase (DUF899 family)